MDEFTKAKVRRAMRNNPDLPVRFVITAITQSQQFHPSKRDLNNLSDHCYQKYVRRQRKNGVSEHLSQYDWLNN